MHIYIKSFNRAYLLHRTIASIYQFLIGFDGKIVVLDDGTPQKYLNKIQELFPEILIVKSPDYNQKTKNILARIETQNIIPAAFWRDEVLKGSDHFILLEDDMWFSKPINYKEFTTEVEHYNLDMIKFMWLKNPKLISANIINKTKYFHIVQPKVLTENVFFFDAIFRTNKWKLGSFVTKLLNHNDELLKYYHLYSVAGAVFSKRYYETCWNSSQDNVDELRQISQLLKSKMNCNVGNFKEEILKTTLKTTATLIAKENLGTTVDIFKINKILNEEWLKGNTYNIEEFNLDIPNNWIKNCFLKLNKGDDLYSNWEIWYEAFCLTYKRIGSEV